MASVAPPHLHAPQQQQQQQIPQDVGGGVTSAAQVLASTAFLAQVHANPSLSITHADQLRQANATLVNLRNAPLPYAACLTILTTSDDAFAHFHAASTIRAALLREGFGSQDVPPRLSTPDRKTIVTQLAQLPINANQHNSAVAVHAVRRAWAMAVKSVWLDESQQDRRSLLATMLPALDAANITTPQQAMAYADAAVCIVDAFDADGGKQWRHHHVACRQAFEDASVPPETSVLYRGIFAPLVHLANTFVPATDNNEAAAKIITALSKCLGWFDTRDERGGDGDANDDANDDADNQATVIPRFSSRRAYELYTNAQASFTWLPTLLRDPSDTPVTRAARELAVLLVAGAPPNDAGDVNEDDASMMQLIALLLPLLIPTATETSSLTPEHAHALGARLTTAARACRAAAAVHGGMNSERAFPGFHAAAAALVALCARCGCAREDADESAWSVAAAGMLTSAFHYSTADAGRLWHAPGRLSAPPPEARQACQSAYESLVAAHLAEVERICMEEEDDDEQLAAGAAAAEESARTLALLARRAGVDAVSRIVTSLATAADRALADETQASTSGGPDDEVSRAKRLETLCFVWNAVCDIAADEGEIDPPAELVCIEADDWPEATREAAHASSASWLAGTSLLRGATAASGGGVELSPKCLEVLCRCLRRWAEVYLLPRDDVITPATQAAGVLVAETTASTAAFEACTNLCLKSWGQPGEAMLHVEAARLFKSLCAMGSPTRSRIAHASPALRRVAVAFAAGETGELFKALLPKHQRLLASGLAAAVPTVVVAESLGVFARAAATATSAPAAQAGAGAAEEIAARHYARVRGICDAMQVGKMDAAAIAELSKPTDAWPAALTWHGILVARAPAAWGSHTEALASIDTLLRAVGTALDTGAADVAYANMLASLVEGAATASARQLVALDRTTGGGVDAEEEAHARYRAYKACMRLLATCGTISAALADPSGVVPTSLARCVLSQCHGAAANVKAQVLATPGKWPKLTSSFFDATAGVLIACPHALSCMAGSPELDALLDAVERGACTPERVEVTARMRCFDALAKLSECMHAQNVSGSQQAAVTRARLALSLERVLGALLSGELGAASGAAEASDAVWHLSRLNPDTLTACVRAFDARAQGAPQVRAALEAVVVGASSVPVNNRLAMRDARRKFKEKLVACCTACQLCVPATA